MKKKKKKLKKITHVDMWTSHGKKAWQAQSKELIDYVNRLIEQHFCRMFEVRKGFVYLVIDHWKVIDYKKLAKRVKLSKVNGELKEGYYYLTHTI